MVYALCVACGKSVSPTASRFEVREGDKLFHLDCYRLYKRQGPPAELRTAFRRPSAGGGDSDTQIMIEALVTGAACLECLFSKTGLPEAKIIDSLRRLRDGVNITAGPCPRCGNKDRLLCGLAA